MKENLDKENVNQKEHTKGTKANSKRFSAILTEKVNAEIGARIGTARKKAGYTQAEFAKKIGATRSEVAKFETGKRGIRPDLMIEIAKVLTLDINYIFTGQMKAQPLTFEAEEQITAYSNNMQRRAALNFILSQPEGFETLDAIYYYLTANLEKVTIKQGGKDKNVSTEKIYLVTGGEFFGTVQLTRNQIDELFLSEVLDCLKEWKARIRLSKTVPITQVRKQTVDYVIASEKVFYYVSNLSNEEKKKYSHMLELIAKVNSIEKVIGILTDYEAPQDLIAEIKDLQYYVDETEEF